MQTENPTGNLCLYCNSPIKGRKDKKFCNADCRNIHNNTERQDKEAFLISVNSQLRRNWKILKTLNPQGKSTVRKQFLLDQGYNFNYFTNIFKSTSGISYFFCYDLGLSEVDKEHVCIINWQPFMEQYQIPIALLK